MIVHDAAEAFTSLIDAAFLWVETLAAALAFVICVIGLTAAPAFAPTTRRSIRPATRARRVPSWAHTEPYDYDEAA